MNLTNYLVAGEQLSWISEKGTTMIHLDPEFTECYEFQKFDRVLGLICRTSGSMVSQHYLGLCNITARQKPECKTLTLPFHDNQLITYKMLNQILVASYAPFKGNCTISIYNVNDSTQVFYITLPFSYPCYIEDIELINTYHNNMFLVSDRIRGLAFYDLNFENSFSSVYISSLKFPGEIFQIQKSIASTHEYVLIKSFESYHIYLVGIEDLAAPAILREFSNIYHSDITSSITNGNALNFNENWIVSQVKTYHEERGFWNIFDQHGPDKNMPSFILLQNFQWISPIYWYDDYLIIKRRTAFDLYRISNLELQIKSLSPSEVGSNVTIQIDLSSIYNQNKTAYIDLLFLEQNSKEAVFRKSDDSTKLLAGANSSYIMSKYVSAPNLSLKWNLSDPQIAQVEYQSYYGGFQIVEIPPPFRKNCLKQYYINLKYEENNPQEGQNLHYFCIQNEQHSIIYERYTQASDDVYMQTIKSELIHFQSVRQTVLNVVAILQNSGDKSSAPFFNSVSFYTLQDKLIFEHNQNISNFVLHEQRFLFTNSKDLVVLLQSGKQELRFAFIIQSPCCSFDLQHAAPYSTQDIIQDIIFADLYTVYVIQNCNIDVIQVIAYQQVIYLAHRNQINLCFIKIVYFEALEKFLVFTQDYSLQVYRNKYSDSLLYSLTSLPLFYEGLQIITRTSGTPLFHAFNSRVLIFFKDTHNDIVASLYDLTQNIHECLLFASYLQWNNGTKLSADVIEQSSSLLTGTLKLNDTVNFLLTTDSLKILIASNLQSQLKVYSTTRNDQFGLTFTTALDPITNYPTPVYNVSDWPTKVNIKFHMQGSGFLVGVGKHKTLYYNIDGAFISDELIQVGLDSLFHGYYLNYAICNKSASMFGDAVGIATPQTIKQEDLSNVLISGITQQVFQYKNYIMIVDDKGLISGFPVTEDGPSQFQSEEFANLKDYGLENVTYVISFHDAFSGPVEYYFWVVQATVIDKEQTVLVIFQVIDNLDGSLQQVNLKEVHTQNISLPILEMKYSGRWNTLCFTTLPFNQINNIMYLFSLSWDPENEAPRATFSTMLSTFTFSISPFNIQSFSFNQEIPLILLGLRERGVLGIHVYSHLVVFAIDIAQFKLVHPFELIDKPLEVAGINFLSVNETTVFINYVGIVHFHFNYKFKLPTNPTVIVSIQSSQASYISGPNLYIQDVSENDDLDSEVTNLLQITYENMYITPVAFDAQRVKLWGAQYLEVWLSYDSFTLNWKINFFNYMQGRFSKQFKSFEVHNGVICYYLYHDTYRSFYPYNVSFLVFCQNSYQRGLLWRYDVLLNTVLYINSTQLRSFHHSSTFEVEIEASSATGTMHSATVQISYTSNTTDYSSLYGLIGVFIIGGLILLISLAGKFIAERLQEKVEEQNFDTYYSLLQTITYRNKHNFRNQTLITEIEKRGSEEALDRSAWYSEGGASVLRKQKLEVIPEQ